MTPLIQDNYYKDIQRIDLEKSKNEETGEVTWKGKVFVNGYSDEAGTELLAQKEVSVSWILEADMGQLLMTVFGKIG